MERGGCWSRAVAEEGLLREQNCYWHTMGCCWGRVVAGTELLLAHLEVFLGKGRCGNRTVIGAPRSVAEARSLRK